VAEIVTGNGWKTVYSRYRLRARDLAFDAVWIVEVDATAAALGRQTGGFESRDRIGGIVIRDAVAVMVQTGFLALEQRQPTFAGGEKAFSSRRLQAKMFLIPFLRALNVTHAEGDVIEIGGIKGGGRVRRTRWASWVC
jgi:hypothetical protein